MTRTKKPARTVSPARTQAGSDLQAPVRASIADVAADVATNLAAFNDHSARHENGGADELNVAGLNGLLADPQTPAAHKVSHQNAGADEIDVTGLSGVLADPQTPAAHAASHATGAGDALNVTTLAGFPGGTDNVLRANGTFGAPAKPVPGVTGTFTTVDGKTITVTDGAITSIV